MTRNRARIWPRQHGRRRLRPRAAAAHDGHPGEGAVTARRVAQPQLDAIVGGGAVYG